MPLCGSGQYSMLPADTYRSKESVGKGRSSASPCEITQEFMIKQNLHSLPLDIDLLTSTANVLPCRAKGVSTFFHRV